jgi:hypothetical protein
MYNYWLCVSNFTLPACMQTKFCGTPDRGATAPQIPVLSALCQLNLLNPPPEKKISGYATDIQCSSTRSDIRLFFCITINVS